MSLPDRVVKCGFIGLGSQGAPMARRMIEAGYPTVLWARRPESLEPYQGSAAGFAASPAELAAQVEHVGVCVVDDAGVREICGQLLPALPAGARLAIHSTIHPETVRDIARQAAARGIAVVDAPVSGGQPAAEAGKLTVMIGGEAEAVAQARPVFETFGALLVHLGGVGAGQEAKLVNNALMAANMAVAHHALEAGRELGIDKAALVQLLQASSGRSFALEVCARLPTPADFRHGGALLAKDVRLLGEVLGDAPGAAGLSAAAQPFLDQVLRD